MSGAAINRDKCAILKQGKRVPNEFVGLGVQQVDSVKICGVWFGEAAQEKNEKHILDGMRDRVNKYEKRNLNLYTRTTIINTVILAKL